MTKAIYSLKVWLFQFQFKLTARESNSLLRLNLFLANIYLKFWFQASVASTAPISDLHMLQSLHSYPDQDISEATSRKLCRQPWYLSEVLILLSLFDAEVSLATKCEIVKAARERDGEKDPPKRALVDMKNTAVQQKTLVDFVSKSSKNLFTFWVCLTVSSLLILYCDPAEMTSWLQRH